MQKDQFQPDDVLAFWFPESGHQNSGETHGAFWAERMYGGMDGVIKTRFADLTRAAAIGQLDDWAATPRGRLALLIALDQFPRSLWRDTPAAYGQDIKAARLALEGLSNGHVGALAPWEQAFFHISVLHCEGPDHLARIDRVEALVDQIAAILPAPISLFGDTCRAQHNRVRNVIERFGRHPHRNEILGRISTPDELEYIAKGNFPHLKKIEAAS